MKDITKPERDEEKPTAVVIKPSKKKKEDTRLTAQDIENSPKYLGLKSLLAKIPEEQRADLKIDRDKIAKINFSIERMKHGLSSKLAMICTGHACTYKDTCPFVEVGVVTKLLGIPCPIEEDLIEVWKGQYIDALDINPENKIEMDRVNDLIEADILDMRTSGIISTEGLFDKQAMGFDRHGNLIERKEIGVAVNAKLLFKKRKDAIIKEFMATREMRAKYKLSKNVDSSTYSANLMAAASKYQRDVHEADWEEASEENDSGDS